MLDIRKPRFSSVITSNLPQLDKLFNRSMDLLNFKSSIPWVAGERASNVMLDCGSSGRGIGGDLSLPNFTSKVLYASNGVDSTSDVKQPYTLSEQSIRARPVSILWSKYGTFSLSALRMLKHHLDWQQRHRRLCLSSQRRTLACSQHDARLKDPNLSRSA